MRRTVLPPQTTAAMGADSREAAGSSLDALRVMRECLVELGPRGLFRGALPRLAHVTVMVVIQLVAYDWAKALLGLPLAGGGGH